MANLPFHSQVHPIFMLSIADLLLAVMWVVGGAVWLSGGLEGDHYNRVGCFSILLITIVSWYELMVLLGVIDWFLIVGRFWSVLASI